MSAPTASQKQDRKVKTQDLMSNIMTGGEISKKREAELEEAANRGRGIQFVETTGTVKGVKRIDPATGKKMTVTKTGATAADYTGKIISSAPTGGELIGDASRAVFGGKADDSYLREGISTAPGKKTTDYRQYLPETKKEKGIVPSFIEKGGAVGSIVKGLVKKPKEKKITAQSILAKKRQGYKDDPYSVPSLLLGGSKQKLGDS